MPSQSDVWVSPKIGTADHFESLFYGKNHFRRWFPSAMDVYNSKDQAKNKTKKGAKPKNND